MRFLLMGVFASFLSAQDPVTVRSMSLVTGRGELLQFSRDVGRVVISEPKIADAIIVSPRDVMVTAKGAGHTTLVVWENDSAPVRYDISVATDTSEHDALYKNLMGELKNAMPQTPIQFSGNAESIVLTGNASSAESQRAQAIAASYS